MRIPRHAQSAEVGFNMTPMIDVVFQLIIFFLLSGHLVKQEAQMSLPLPSAVSGEKRRDEAAPRLVINVLENGELVMAGRPAAPDELPDRMRQRFAETGPDLEVVIRCHRDATFEHTETIMKACYRAGLANIAIAVYRPEDAP